MTSNPEEHLDDVYERLGVSGACEITLAPTEQTVQHRRVYTARSRRALVHVDRPLAVRLRVYGARWAGDVALDPCGVA